MILELVGQLWLVLAALTCYYSMRATYREWGYNKNITTGDNMSKQSKATQRKLQCIKAARGVEREQHFSGGGDLVSWRGGTRTVTVDRKKQQSKSACRGKWQ
jgi:hypothetical protein